MGHMCSMHVSEESIDCTVYISALFCSKCKNYSENMPLGVFIHSMNKLMYESVSPYVCAQLCVHVCVVGRADKQAVGWEVEGVHRLRLLTQFWQNATPGAPRNLAGGAQRCNLIPSIQHTAPKSTQRQAASDTALSILIPLLVSFSSLCVTISFRGFL